MNEEQNVATQTEQVEGQKTYTEEEMMNLLQRETDRRVSSALAKQQKKFEEKMAESDKLRQMNEEQRAHYEFEQKVKEFEQQKKEFAIIQNKLEASKILSERGLPAQFVDYIVADDAETMLDNINAFDKLFKAAVNDAVSKKIVIASDKCLLKAKINEKEVSNNFQKESVEKICVIEKNEQEYVSLEVLEKAYDYDITKYKKIGQ